MELKKELIHLEKEYPAVTSQFAIEEDIIIPDQKPDILEVLLHKSTLLITGFRIMEQHVNISGIFRYSVLYTPEDDPSTMDALQGEIPMEESVFVEGLENTDFVQINANVEDMAVRIINSRKCNLHALISLSAVKSEIYDEEIPVGIACDAPAFSPLDEETQEQANSTITQICPMDYLELCTFKKDICRIHEEVKLPDSFPNIASILWNHVAMNDVEIVPVQGQINFSCNLQIFFLYLCQGEDRSIRYLETTIPYQTALECPGSEANYIPNINFLLTSANFEIRNDSDGEPRGVSLDQVFDFHIRLYQEKTISCLTDLYNCRKKCLITRKNIRIPSLCTHSFTRCTVKGTTTFNGQAQNNLQLIYPSSHLVTDTPVIQDDNITITGFLEVQALYVENQESPVYSSLPAKIPFQHTIAIADICSDAMSAISVNLDKVSISSVSNNELEIKANVCYEVLVHSAEEKNMICEVTYVDYDKEKDNELPGIVIYFVRSGDTLWDIGKTYRIPTEEIKRENELNSEQLSPGQKLLLIR
ncbi:MAG: SPOCS domain-containing protein [Lachnospiraceae bacterium]